MKKYTIKIGEIFTKEKANELIEYLQSKDEEIERLKECPACKEK